MNRLVRGLPFALTTLRIALAPVLYWMARDGSAGLTYVAIIVVAFASDVCDGVLARKLGVATPALRAYDSRADLVFYATAMWTVWMVHPEVVRRLAWFATLLVALEIVRPVFDTLKFGRTAAYHMWSAKAWGVSVVIALILLMGFGISGPFVWAAVLFGIVADMEGLAISLLLREWTHDVPTVLHALRLRRARRLAELSAAP